MCKQSFLQNKNRHSKNSYVNLRYQNFQYNTDIGAQIFTRHIHALFVCEATALSVLHRHIANHIFAAQYRMSVVSVCVYSVSAAVLKEEPY